MNLDEVVFNPKDGAAINYVKARMAIEETMPCRAAKRSAKMVVIDHLGGTIKHPTEQELRHGATKLVIFHDNTRARF